MRNVPLNVNQTFFLTNRQESEVTDAEVSALVEQELRRRPVRVKRIERDSMGAVRQIHLDIG